MTSLESKLKKILNKIGREKAVCPEQSELAAFVDGSLGPADEARTKHHLAGCAKCAELVRISLELEEEMPQRAPEAALDSAKAAFKPTLSKRARHFAEELLNGKRESGQEPAPALAVRAAESLRKPSSREYAREFCGYLMEATIEHVMGDQYQVIIRMKDKDRQQKNPKCEFVHHPTSEFMRVKGAIRSSPQCVQQPKSPLTQTRSATKRRSESHCRQKRIHSTGTASLATRWVVSGSSGMPAATDSAGGRGRLSVADAVAINSSNGRVWQKSKIFYSFFNE